MNPVLALIIANIIWGAASPIFKYALTDIPPFILLFVRFFGASFIFLPFIRKYHFENITLKDWSYIVVGTLFAFTIHIGSLFFGLQKTESINAPIILSAAPLFLVMAAWFFLKEKLKMKTIMGTVVSFLGILILIISPILAKNGLDGFAEQIEGNVLYVISTISLVVSILIFKPITKKIPPLVMTYLSFVIASASFFPFALTELQTWSFADLSLPGIVGIIFGLFFSSAIAYWLYFYGISKIPAQEVGIFTYTDPIVGILVAAPLLGEFPDQFFIIGSILVFGGIFISEGRLHYHPFHRLARKKV